MNQNQPTDPGASPELSAINERVTASIRSHQHKIRALTGVAFLLGFLAITASVIIISGYFIFYRPKEKEVLRQVTLAAEQARAKPGPADGGAASTPKLPFDFPSVQATMTYFHSVLITLLAAALGLLALGTVVLVAVIILNRRVTLQQVNASLAQISFQLREQQMRERGQ